MYKRLFSALAVAVLVAGACSSSTPVKKIVVAEWQFPDTVNIYYAQAETDVEIGTSMFLNLVDVTPDLRTVPTLVTSVPTLANGGVKMNGAGMDGTWNWIMDKANTGLAGGIIGWGDITGITGGTGTTCVMSFGKVYEGYLYLVAPLLPAKYISSISAADAVEVALVH